MNTIDKIIEAVEYGFLMNYLTDLGTYRHEGDSMDHLRCQDRLTGHTIEISTLAELGAAIEYYQQVARDSVRYSGVGGAFFEDGK